MWDLLNGFGRSISPLSCDLFSFLFVEHLFFHSWLFTGIISHKNVLKYKSLKARLYNTCNVIHLTINSDVSNF